MCVCVCVCVRAHVCEEITIEDVTTDIYSIHDNIIVFDAYSFIHTLGHPLFLTRLRRFSWWFRIVKRF